MHRTSLICILAMACITSVSAFAPLAPLAISNNNNCANHLHRLLNTPRAAIPMKTIFGKSMPPWPKKTVLQMANDDDDKPWMPSKSSAMVGGAGVSNAGEPPFEIRGFSLGNLVCIAGLVITALSFVEYITQSGGEGLSVSGLGFVYGIPVFLAGAALKYAEIAPVQCYSTPEADVAFEKHATEVLKKVKSDVTRHRYGDEAHLDTTVKKLGLVLSGKSYPQLQYLRQEATPNGELTFTIVWQSLDTPYKMWAEEGRVKRYERFFGPGVNAECVKIDADQRLVGIRLTTGPKVTPDKSSLSATSSVSGAVKAEEAPAVSE